MYHLIVSLFSLFSVSVSPLYCGFVAIIREPATFTWFKRKWVALCHQIWLRTIIRSFSLSLSPRVSSNYACKYHCIHVSRRHICLFLFCFVILCFSNVMGWGAMVCLWCDAMEYSLMLCDGIFCDVNWCYFILCNLFDAMGRYLMLCDVFWFYEISCCVMFCYFISCFLSLGANVLLRGLFFNNRQRTSFLACLALGQRKIRNTVIIILQKLVAFQWVSVSFQCDEYKHVQLNLILHVKNTSESREGEVGIFFC